MRGLRDIQKQRQGGGFGGGRTAKIVRLPAPIKGWNTSSPSQVLDPEQAIVLTNMICRSTGVETREGTASWSTGLGAPVNTLMEYAPAGTGGKLFAAAGASIFDVTGGGAVGAAVVTSLTSSYFRHTMMATSAGQFLFIVNGADAPRHYNGSTWATPSITGVTAANLTHVANHKNRLWFVEKDTLTAWYLPTSSVAGVASSFPFGGYCRRGGFLVALGSWSRDGGNGADDLFVAITSEGETLVWAGTDPAAANTWSLVGVFQLPPPIGPRCMVKAGADLGITTVRGIVSLNTVLTTAETQQAQTALTRSIDDEFQRAFQTIGYSAAWQVLEIPSQRIVLVNVPLSPIVQYCLGAETGGWSLWNGILATSWGLRDEIVHFGTASGTVMRYGGSYDDSAQPITVRVLPAFSTLRDAMGKRLSLVRPIMQTALSTNPKFEARFDFDTRALTVTPVVPAATVLWDVSDWNISSWLLPIQPFVKWQSITGNGISVSIGMAASLDTKITLQGFDLVFDSGGIL
jgi:hypothetical protein